MRQDTCPTHTPDGCEWLENLTLLKLSAKPTIFQKLRPSHFFYDRYGFVRIHRHFFEGHKEEFVKLLRELVHRFPEDARRHPDPELRELLCEGLRSERRLAGAEPPPPPGRSNAAAESGRASAAGRGGSGNPDGMTGPEYSPPVTICPCDVSTYEEG